MVISTDCHDLILIVSISEEWPLLKHEQAKKPLQFLAPFLSASISVVLKSKVVIITLLE